MEVGGKPVLIMGGYGLVGQAVARKLLTRDPPLRPTKLVIHSLRREEAKQAVDELQSQARDVALVPEWGNVLTLTDYKDRSPRDVLTDPPARRRLAQLLYTPLLRANAREFYLYRLIVDHEPALIVDAVNTATAIAYADLYEKTAQLLSSASDELPSDVRSRDLLEEFVTAAYLPLLIRHTQVLYSAMTASGTKAYIKIGTSGTGGMGFNIPYTHSEERPSAELLTKSAVAGAHTMLLFLMSRTPDAPPIIKEIKPAAAIAWKRIAFGPIIRRGEALALYDLGTAGRVRVRPGDTFSSNVSSDGFEKIADRFESVFIDTGENGLFSLDEFSALTTADQMQFVTPEEIAEIVLREVEGSSTGHDVIDALDHSVLPGSYRAGLMRHWALRRLTALERLKNVKSVAFENLGPPRLTKLLFEAHILRCVSNDNARTVLETSADKLAEWARTLVEGDKHLRSEMISVGIPILVSNELVLRGPEVKVPSGMNPETVTDDLRDRWAEAGWVDLRPSNMAKWKERFAQIEDEIRLIPEQDSSSHYLRDRRFWGWGDDYKILPGKLVGWIFSAEGGQRMIAT